MEIFETTKEGAPHARTRGRYLQLTEPNDPLLNLISGTNIVGIS